MTSPRTWLLVSMLTAAIGCDGTSIAPGSQGADPAATGPIRVVCTTGMVGDLVEHVGGDRVEVTSLMGEGVDPHLYKASPGDIRLLSGADLIVYNGLHLEGKMAEVLERMSRRTPTHAVAEGVAEDRLLLSATGVPDPHLWFDVALWSDGLEVVREALASFDPEHADAYRARADAYRAELFSLDEEVRARLAAIAPSNRVLVTAHDAFGYFGRAYDVEVRAIQGISTESEAGVREINDLVDFIARRGIKAVFVESSVSDRNIRALIEGCRARGHEVVIGGQLYSDAMGRPGTPEGTYGGMVRHNVETIVASLR